MIGKRTAHSGVITMATVGVFRRGGRARSLLGRYRRVLPRSAYVATWLRYQAESRVLVPGASRLPLPLLRLFASMCAAFESFTRLGQIYRGELRSSHGLRGVALQRAVFERVLRGYLDAVYFARGAARGGTPEGFGTRVSLPGDVEAHLRAGRPLVIVGVHFSFAFSYATASRLRDLQLEVQGPGAVFATVVAAEAPPGRHPGIQLDRLRSRLMEHALQTVGAGAPSVHHIRVSPDRAASTAMQLVRDTRAPGSVVMITLDREWTSGSAYRRPFAGFDSWGLSTGWARLATAADAGVVAISPSPAPGGGVEWSPLRLARDFPTIEALVDHFADDLERRIGRFPTGYQLALGRPRRWDAASDSWVSVSR